MTQIESEAGKKGKAVVMIVVVERPPERAVASEPPAPEEAG